VARTHRKHLSPNALAKRGGQLSRDKDPKVVKKSHKQTRPNERARLKKEYL
jgi:hypothetical protein